MIGMRRTWLTYVTVGLIVSLGGCAAILGIDPTEVVAGGVGSGDGGNGPDGGAGGSDGGSHEGGGGDGGSGDTPAFDPACAIAITTLDANGEAAAPIVADNAGIYWARPQDASTSLIWANFGGVTTLVVGTEDGDSTNDQPTVIGLALTPTHLYWSAWDTYLNDGTTTARVRQSDRNGGAITDLDLSDAGPGVSELTLVDGKLYFGNWRILGNAHLYSVTLPISANQKPFNESGGLNSPLHFAGGADAIYYDEATATDLTPQNQVAIASATAGNPNEIETTAHSVEDLVVGDGDSVYWAQTPDSEIRMHSNDRASATQPFATISSPHLLAYDADHHMLYVATSSPADVWSVQRFATNGTTPPPQQMCVDNLTHVSAIQYFGGHFYFSATSTSQGSALFDLTIK